jgi:hypothetical protein
MLTEILLAGAATAAANVSALPAFMTGCWDLLEGDHWTQECWMEPKAGMMLGASREGTGSTLKSWEHMRIEQSSDGKLVLFASPHGKPAVAFPARTASESAVEFVNPTHDYPQRITYELKGDKLEAEISLSDGKKPIRWTYQRESR